MKGQDDIREVIHKTKEYLLYIKEHYDNVQLAWRHLKLTCRDMRFIADDFIYHSLDEEIRNHDLSKLSHEEFVPYRIKFFPTEFEIKGLKEGNLKIDFDQVWEHHQTHNPHHWQNWTNANYAHPYSAEIHCVHMVADWMAMSMSHDTGTARDFYEANKSEIELPDWAVDFIYEIFDKVYRESME